jgi:type IX secretion system PorP/SprF family membrane protein
MKQPFILYTSLIFFLFASASTSAQDKLFTQSFAHPVDLNPSFSGSIEGRYRITMAYRDQWRSIIESPFTTMGLYGDIKIINEKQSDDFFGAGFSLIADRTAIYNVNQNIISLYGSYHKALNADKQQYLSAGLNFGIAQRNMNYENIYFNDQFNGLDQYSLTTAEILPSNNFAFMDLGLGVSFMTGLSDFSDLSLGISVDHIPGSSISFYKHSIDQDIEYPDATIYRKVTTYVSMELASDEYISVLPRFIWQKEGPHQMISAAALVKFDITNYDDKAFHVGGGFRLNQTSSSSLKPTAVYILTAFEIEGLLIGLSHDITTTSLGSLSPGRGAFELSISFTGLYENDESMCPTF